MKNPRYLPRAIKAAKNKLIKRVEKKGKPNNFGVLEVQIIRNDYIHVDSLDKYVELVDEFAVWCEEVEG